MERRKKFVENEVILSFTSQIEDILKASGAANLPTLEDAENFTSYSCIECGEEYNYEDEAEECCNTGSEVSTKNILEWWIVSEYLSNRLREYGEAILDWNGLKIWGRTESGQAIYLDEVIGDIVKTQSCN